MRLLWQPPALHDLARLQDFVQAVNPRAAAALRQRLQTGVLLLLEHPNIGVALPEFAPREVRRWPADDHEVRYELRDATVHILRLWHTREDR